MAGRSGKADLESLGGGSAGPLPPVTFFDISTLYPTPVGAEERLPLPAADADQGVVLCGGRYPPCEDAVVPFDEEDSAAPELVEGPLSLGKASPDVCCGGGMDPGTFGEPKLAELDPAALATRSHRLRAPCWDVRAAAEFLAFRTRPEVIPAYPVPTAFGTRSGN